VALTTHPHLVPRLNRVEIYLYYPSVPSWHLTGQNLFLPLHKLLKNYPISKLMKILMTG